jgi:23S rRNA (uracil1939-C5)-methyltransferase
MSRRGPREVPLTVSALSNDGLGQGWLESRSVEARNALPGERVLVRVRQRRGGVWYGEAEQVEEASSMRRDPPCSAFPRCSGCVLQHLDYAQQLAHKSARLQAELAGHGVRPLRIRPPVAAVQLHYRHKARLGVRVVDGEVLIGFREGFSNRIARSPGCMTLAQPFDAMLPQLKEALQRLRHPDRVPQIEIAGGDHEFAVIVRHLTELDERELRVLEAFGRDQRMRIYLQPGGYDSIRRLGEGGDEYLTYANPDFGLCYRFLPTDFIQVNPYLNRALVRAVVLGLTPRSGRRVSDMFCGIGNFSLALARAGLQVLGYESSAAAVERAQLNARGNGLCGQAEFRVTDLYDARCPDLPPTEYLVLDPPRSGAGPNLPRWASWPNLQRIAYVSCNPRTFAADAAVLGAHGFNLEEAGIFDMFPHTAHVETLGFFSRDAGSTAHRG